MKRRRRYQPAIAFGGLLMVLAGGVVIVSTYSMHGIFGRDTPVMAAAGVLIAVGWGLQLYFGKRRHR